MDIRMEIKNRRLFFDGGTGTVLQARGLKPGDLLEYRPAPDDPGNEEAAAEQA